MDIGPLVGLVGSVAAVVTVFVAVLAWRRPKGPADPDRARRKVSVEVAYAMPLFDMPDGSQEFGEDLVSVTARNATAHAVKINGWGVHLPGDRNLVVGKPTTRWEPSLPAWVKPGDDATWYLPVDEVRAQAATLGCTFGSMKAYVSLADGREVIADLGMPLK